MKILTVNSKQLTSWISGISIRYFENTHTVQWPCKYYFISITSNKTSRKKHVSKKSTFCYINMLVFKLEIVTDILENEKLNLNLNCMN